MAASQEQKVDYLLKKIGYVSSKTGIAEDSGISGTKKAPFAEPIPSPLVTPSTSIWADSTLVPSTPPNSNTSYVGIYGSGNAFQMTYDNTVSGNRSFVARTTAGDQSSAISGDWIDPSFGADYAVVVYKGDPNSGGVSLPAAGSGSNDTWFFDYSSGVLNFNGTVVPTGITTNNVYLVGYRYTGAKGLLPPAGEAQFSTLEVTTGISTFGGDLDVNASVDISNNLNVSGIATLSDLEVVGSGTPTISSPGTLNLNANTVAISTDLTVGDLLTADNITLVGTGNTATITGPDNIVIDPATVGDNTGTVIILGDLRVDGETTTINSTTLTIDDKSIVVASGATDSAAANGAGIEVDGAGATFQYSHTGTKWVSNKDLQAEAFIKTSNSAGFLKADGTEDTNTYLTSETDTLDSVTNRGSTTTNNITVGKLSVIGTGNTGIIDSTNSDIIINPLSGGDANAGRVIIQGGLQVDGTTTTINSTTLTIDDKLIVVSSGATDGLTADGAGLVVDGADAHLKYHYNAGSNETFELNKNVGIGTDNADAKLDVRGDVDITGNLVVTSTDADSGFAPYIDLYRNSPSPDVSDTLGRIRFYGENDADEKTLYGYIQGEIIDETDGTEDGVIKTYVITNGTNEQRFSVSGSSSTKFFNKSVLLTSGVDLIFEGATNNTNETTLTVVDPTQDNTITFPDATGTVLLNVIEDTTPQLGGNLDANSKDITGVNNLNVSGISTFTDNVSFGSTATFGDDDKLKFGDDGDLHIFHDGNYSYIKDTGTGGLVINTDALYIKNASDTEALAYSVQDSAVSLYFDNSKKFETIGAGVTVTGDLLVSNDARISGVLTVGQSSVTIDGTDNSIHGYDVLIAPPKKNSTVELTVTVATKTNEHRYYNQQSANGYHVNGVEAPFLTLTPGRTYRFDQSDTTNSNHPLRFYREASDTSTLYETNVTYGSASPGQTGAYTQIVVTDDTPTILHYQCSSHLLMGNSLQCNSTSSSIDGVSSGIYGDGRYVPQITVNTEGKITSISAVEIFNNGLGSDLDLNNYNIAGTGGVNITGIVTATSFRGDAANMTGLTGVGAGTYGSANTIPVVTVASDGRIESISTVLASGGGGGGGGSAAVTRTVTSFTATANQTTFNVSYTVGTIDVFVNGSRLSAAEFTATNGTSVVLATGASVGDVVDVAAYASSLGMDIRNNGTSVGTATTINFSTDLNVSMNGNTATVTSTASGGSGGGISEELAIAYSIAL